jgi:hypothetical protein
MGFKVNNNKPLSLNNINQLMFVMERCFILCADYIFKYHLDVLRFQILKNKGEVTSRHAAYTKLCEDLPARSDTRM